MSIAYRITAVPERFWNAIKEAAALGVGQDCIYLDESHRGNIWNKFRVYEDVICDKSITHVCMNDDDVFIPNGFVTAVNGLVSRFPDKILCFYNSAIGSDKPCIYRLMNHYMNGASCVIPTSILPSFLRFYRKNLDGFKWDDTAMSLFAFFNDIDVLLPAPKIMDVICMESTLPMRRRMVQPHNAGKVYKDGINTNEIIYAPIIDRKTKALHTHLKEEHPINIAFKNKWRDIK